MLKFYRRAMHAIALSLLLLSFMLLSPAARAGTNVADPVQVVDVRGMTYWETLSFVSLQGLVNRDKGELFLITKSSDRRWMKWYDNQYGVRFNEIENPWRAFNRFKDQFAGWCVVDVASPHTMQLGATFASLREFVPITQHAKQAHQQVLPKKSSGVDLRGRFNGSVAEIYKWAIQNQWPRTNQEVLGSFKAPVQAVDISAATKEHKTLFVKFEDSKPESRDRMELNSFRVLHQDGRIAAKLTPGTENEKQHLVAEEGTGVGGGSRVARKDDYWIYKIPDVGGADHALMDIDNQFKVSIAASENGPWKQVLRETSDSTAFLRNNYGADWVVAQRGQVIGLSSNPSEKREYALKDQLYKNAPPQALVMGWHTGEESQHLTHASKRNLLVLCSNTASNFSFHQYVGPDTPVRERVNPPSFDEVALNKDKVYVSFVMSDGDSPNFMFNFMHGHWFNEARGSFPMGWEMQMAFQKMAPGVMDYYYRKASDKDHFIASASGLAYSFPDKMSKTDLRELLQVSRPWFKRTGLKSLVILPDSGTLSSGKKQLYAKQLGGAIHGVQEGYWRTNS